MQFGSSQNIQIIGPASYPSMKMFQDTIVISRPYNYPSTDTFPSSFDSSHSIVGSPSVPSNQMFQPTFISSRKYNYTVDYFELRTQPAWTGIIPHELVSAVHLAANLIPGTYLKALTSTTFGFAPLPDPPPSMIYPGAGISISTGTAWSTSITPATGYLRYTGLAWEFKNETYVTGTPWTGMGYVTGTPWTSMGYITGTPWTAMGYVTGTPWTGMDYLTSISLGTPWTGLGYVTGTPWTSMGYVTGTPWTSMGYITSNGITPAALTKTNDTNVTITLGGTPETSLLQAVSLTIGWTGTLADSRIASAAAWNGKQSALSGTGYIKISGTTISYVNEAYSLTSHKHSILSTPGGSTAIDTSGGGGTYIVTNFPVLVQGTLTIWDGDIVFGYASYPDDRYIKGIDGVNAVGYMNGSNLIIQGGDAYVTGNNYGGAVFIMPGRKAGSGTVGGIFLGNGSGGIALKGTGTGTSILYYNRTTGEVTFGDK